MAQQANPAPHGMALDHQVEAQHPGLPTGRDDQAGAQSQQSRLPATIGSLHQHRLPGRHCQVQPGEGREPTKDGHHAPEFHH